MKLPARFAIGLSILTASAVASAQSPPATQAADTAVDTLADAMIALQLGYAPASAYFLGVPPPDHRRWPDRRPAAIAEFHRKSDALLADLRKIDPAGLSSASARSTHASMIEQLEAGNQLRVCKSELWDVNHMFGWHLDLAAVAREQPVASAEEREQALERWASLPVLVDQEIANARAGLALGYSSPKPAVLKVIKQVGGMLSADPAGSPFASPGVRAKDAAFKRAYADLIAGPVKEAFVRYRDFLQLEYLPKARDALGVAANPNGAECYRASLRSYTTLDRSPEDVFKIGQETVARNKAEAVEMGRGLFGVGDLPAIVRGIQTAPGNRFASEEEFIVASRDTVARARAKATPFFMAMPSQEMKVEPFPTFLRGSGASSHYEAQIEPSKPAYYRINSERWQGETRGSSEVTAVHEGYPGHHMQIAFSNSLGVRPIANLTSNSAYIEGWARYSEMLAEEAGVYATPYARLTRRLWPARGMVMDPGLHVFGWTREQLVAFMQESGRYAGDEANDLVDRIAVTPGQLTAYDSGGLEIKALREEARRALGDRFDIRQFHQRVLEDGALPLGALRAKIRLWIVAERTK